MFFFFNITFILSMVNFFRLCVRLGLGVAHIVWFIFMSRLVLLCVFVLLANYGLWVSVYYIQTERDGGLMAAHA